ncbi:MAG: EpsG family protein [Clostridium sp.]|nr:EpsG family protein [Clostridium sp.]
MIVYIVLLLVTTSAAFFVVKPQALPARGMSRRMFLNRIGLCAVFLLLFAVSAARYYVGNDYGRYEEYFYNIWYGYVVPTERGFNVLVKCLQTLFGKDNYLFLFAFFAFVTVFFSLKALYTLSASFVFSFYLFMAFGYYYQSLNTVRYYVAVAFALCAIPYLFRKNYVKFILTVLVGALIHKSALIVLPVYLLADCHWKRWQTVLLTVFAASGFVFGDVYLKLILYLYPTYRNTMYLEGGTSYVNIARCAMVLLFCLLVYRDAIQNNRQMLFYFRLNVAALLLYLCGSFLPEVSRIGTYMTVTQVFLLPGAALGIADKKKQRIAVVGVTVFGAIYFAAFLYKAYDELVKLLPYHTWLF